MSNWKNATTIAFVVVGLAFGACAKKSSTTRPLPSKQPSKEQASGETALVPTASVAPTMLQGNWKACSDSVGIVLNFDRDVLKMTYKFFADASCTPGNEISEDYYAYWRFSLGNDAGGASKQILYEDPQGGELIVDVFTLMSGQLRFETNDEIIYTAIY